MADLFWVAGASFREMVRDRILYVLLFFALLLFGFSTVLGSWSTFLSAKVVVDFSLGSMSAIGLLMAIFVGVGLIQKEIQRKTVFALAARPVARWQLLVGKYLGLLLVLALNLVVMMVALYAVLLWDGDPLNGRLWLAAWGLFWEMATITAAALLFSSFSTPIISSLFTLGLYIAGHLSGDLLDYLQTMSRNAARIPGETSMSPLMTWAAQTAHTCIPDLELFNVRTLVANGLPLPDHWMAASLLHGFGWSGIFLVVAAWWFSRRDFV